MQTSTVTIAPGEQLSITVTVVNVLDATCTSLYYKDGSMTAYAWLGESDSQLLELASEIKPSGNLTFTLTGKSPGTAEIKASKDDTSGTELGWFAIFTAEDTVERPILIISMVEDVKGRGGSGYVVKKDRLVLEEWFSSN